MGVDKNVARDRHGLLWSVSRQSSLARKYSRQFRASALAGMFRTCVFSLVYCTPPNDRKTHGGGAGVYCPLAIFFLHLFSIWNIYARVCRVPGKKGPKILKWWGGTLPLFSTAWWLRHTLFTPYTPGCMNTPVTLTQWDATNQPLYTVKPPLVSYTAECVDHVVEKTVKLYLLLEEGEKLLLATKWRHAYTVVGEGRGA